MSSANDSSSAADAPSTTRNHGWCSANASPSTTISDTAAPNCVPKSLNRPTPKTAIPTSSPTTASCSTNRRSPCERSATTAPTSVATPIRYGPICSPSTPLNSRPTTPTSGSAANHAPRAVSSTTGQGRSSCAATPAVSGNRPCATADFKAASKRAASVEWVDSVSGFGWDVIAHLLQPLGDVLTAARLSQWPPATLPPPNPAATTAQ